jgi:hypothetical protein
MPQHTYVARAERDLEQRLLGVADNLCKLATLTGSTKSGKTVLANRVFPRTTGDNIWIDGGTVKAENDLWTQIISELDGFTSAESSSSSEASQGAAAEVSGGLKIPFIASGPAKVGVNVGRQERNCIGAAPGGNCSIARLPEAINN